METDRRGVRADEDQEEVARLFQRYDLVAAPVVDEDDRLVGVITFDDVADVIEEEAEEDIKALGGVPRHEELSDSVWHDRARPFQLAAGQSRDRISGRHRCSGFSKVSCRRWWPSRCWRQSSPVRAAMPRRRP